MCLVWSIASAQGNSVSLTTISQNTVILNEWFKAVLEPIFLLLTHVFYSLWNTQSAGFVEIATLVTYWGVNFGTENFSNINIPLVQVLPAQDPIPTTALAKQAQHPKHFCNSLPWLYPKFIFWENIQTCCTRGGSLQEPFVHLSPTNLFDSFSILLTPPTLHTAMTAGSKGLSTHCTKHFLCFKPALLTPHAGTPAPAQQLLVSNSSTLSSPAALILGNTLV